LIAVAYAKLEFPSSMKNKKATPSVFRNAGDSNDICTTPLSVGESSYYNVTPDITPNITSGYLNIGTGTASSLFFIFYK
jgi:hypothetical protein